MQGALPQISKSVTERKHNGRLRPVPNRRRLSLPLELLVMLTWREIAIRYKQSVMGFFWALFMPCLIVAAGLLVRTAMARLAGTSVAVEQVAAIMVKALPWAFIVSALRLATSSLTGNSNLVTRANCPRIVFPLSATLSAAFDFAVALLPLIVILATLRVHYTLQALWVAPILLLVLALTTGLGIFLAAANLFYRDVKYIVEVVLTFAIFFTPVLYEIDMLPEWKSWVLLNPFSPLLEGLNSAVVLGARPDLAWLAYSAAATVLVSAGAVLLFARVEPAFADRI